MRAAACYFRQKAALCRELAEALASEHDPVVSKLREMADEFDDNARILERRIAREEVEEDVAVDARNLH
ncbi:hypothetical protein [Methylorubrum aminovorans]|uniref:hypothetical protein n=1 Tax=Methylorubrum aminovorans TaxID=269069 RepID=UPI003C2E4F24